MIHSLSEWSSLSLGFTALPSPNGYKIDYVAQTLDILNVEGYQNPEIRLKVTVILLTGWILYREGSAINWATLSSLSVSSYTRLGWQLRLGRQMYRWLFCFFILKAVGNEALITHRRYICFVSRLSEKKLSVKRSLNHFKWETWIFHRNNLMLSET